MKKWEYMVQRLVRRLPEDQPILEKDLEELGQMGWEIISCQKIGTGFENSEVLLFFFKREIPEKPEIDPQEEREVGAVTKLFEGFAKDLRSKLSQSPAEIKLEAISKILNRPGSFEYHTIITTIQKIIKATPEEVQRIAKEYVDRSADPANLDLTDIRGS